MAASGQCGAIGCPARRRSGFVAAVDKAMETLAARVTPAVVNVTVTSRAKAERAGQQMPEDMQQFFGQGNPFGQFGPNMRQRQPQIEHGLGSGVVISPTDTLSPTTT
jgi:serine protease Do